MLSYRDKTEIVATVCLCLGVLTALWVGAGLFHLLPIQHDLLEWWMLPWAVTVIAISALSIPAWIGIARVLCHRIKP